MREGERWSWQLKCVSLGEGVNQIIDGSRNYLSLCLYAPILIFFNFLFCNLCSTNTFDRKCVQCRRTIQHRHIWSKMCSVSDTDTTLTYLIENVFGVGHLYNIDTCDFIRLIHFFKLSSLSVPCLVSVSLLGLYIFKLCIIYIHCF